MTPSSSKSINNTQQIILLDDNDNFHPDFETALKQIFIRFDQDRDGYLNLKEIQLFAKTTNNDEFDQGTLDDIKTYFCDETKLPELMMPQDGFLDMYHLQTQNDPDETWNDLSRLGYGPDLEPISPSSEEPNVQDSIDTTTSSKKTRKRNRNNAEVNQPAHS